MFTSRIAGVSPDLATQIFGLKDQNLRELRERFSVDVIYRDGEIRVSGESQAVLNATKMLELLRQEAERHGSVTSFGTSSNDASSNAEFPIGIQSPIDIVQTGREIRPKTAGQQKYADAIREFDIVFSIGPAGTGKTFLASAMAVEALKNKLIRKIVLVRPAVEAGESLGFLPGDLFAKINPYLRPLLDAIQEMIDYDQLQLLMNRDVIEVAPLAYMRGRTLNDAFIILDEAQNTSVAQMKMFLTRMGTNSKIVVSGDTTQTDLPAHQKSGLIDATERLKSIKGIKIVTLGKNDIVRHRLVQDIVHAYDRKESSR
ncbi:MAG: PhoH family protein [Pirellulaceae bacterium]|nr:PhoH family protein [Pirellulaceae bacterium]